MDDKVGGAVVGGECVSAVVVFDIPAVSRAESLFCRSCGNQDFGATTQVKPFIYRDRAFGGQLQVSETDSVQIRVVDVAFVVKRERESQFQVIQDGETHEKGFVVRRRIVVECNEIPFGIGVAVI